MKLAARSSLAFVMALSSCHFTRTDLPTAVRKEDRRIAGLSAPAEIVIDHWGIPHIFATSARDAFFLQGYNAGRDRLWQVDLWRKRGLGRLSASFGPSYVDQDRAARLLLYRGDMAREWSSYAPETKDAVEAFVAGLNAYVAEVRAGARPLPVEFTLTRSMPETWKAEDVVRIRSHALVSNLTSEVARARVACAAGIEADRLRRKLDPPTHRVVVPDGLDPCDVPADVLRDYTLGTGGVSFAALKDGAGREERELAALNDVALDEGSNNWVVAASKTETGRPILANDPHRALGVPSLRYVVGLDAPGLHLIGAGEPALPGVSLGHNGEIAFGITIFAIDQEDLYVYELDPAQPDRYRYRDGWEPMTVVRETIEIKAAEPREVELRFTRHGPVLKVDAARKRAFALRTVWSEPGASGYLGSSRLWRARTWDEFRAASGAWSAPPLNLVYAGRAGDIGWAASGRTPVRESWDGLVPVPGDGRYEWNGFLAEGLLPSIHDPASGFFASANEYNLPEGYPIEERRIAFEWTDPSRATRIKQVLAADSSVSLSDSMALQSDSVSPQARRVLALLKTLEAPSDPRVAQALELLRAWDGDETVHSAAAAIYEVMASKHLGKSLVAATVPPAARALVGDGHLDAVISALEGPDTEQTRRDVLLRALSGAVAELQERLGADMSAWSWGRLHQASWTPAVAELADPQLKAQMSIGPLQTPGSGSTPRAQTYRPLDFSVVSGASVRIVVDVGRWDDSVVMNSPGQSGDPFVAHYRDLFPMWAEGAYVPLAFSRAAVDRVAESVLKLSPAD